MSKEFISETVQIKKAVEIINGLENDMFRLLVGRISQKVHSNTESFKQEELEKLEKGFGLNNENIRLIIDILEFILLQSVYETIKPSVLYSHLVKLKLTEEKSNAISEVWKENGKEIIEKIKQSKAFTFNRLKNVKWRLNLQMASALKTKQKLPNAIFEFNLSNDMNDKNEAVQVEFDKDQLYDFFLKLETIQKQVDSLNE